MQMKFTRCTQCVGALFCCGVKCIRYGKSRNGNQRYLCKNCRSTRVEKYKYVAYKKDINASIKKHLKEGCSIRSISHILEIAVSTVLRRILRLAGQVKKPFISFGKTYELDEMRTYVKRKTRQCWIVYAMDQTTKEVADFAVGMRTNKTLKRVTDTLLLGRASKVYTDKLSNYRWLLPESIHCTKYRGTNHIERKNLMLRTDLKRLSRRTLCFSKSEKLLSACLKIYFWG